MVEHVPVFQELDREPGEGVSVLLLRGSIDTLLQLWSCTNTAVLYLSF